MLYKVVLTFESEDEIPKCDHWNESYWAVLSCGTVYYAVQGGSNFYVCDRSGESCYRSIYLFIYNQYLDKVVHSARAGLSKALFNKNV